MLGILLFVFTVYRAIDLYLDLYYWFYRVPDAFLIPACVVSCFNLWYIFQFDPNFHPVEAIVNLVQMFVANLRASSDIASGCIYSVDFYYVLCCCCSIVLQVICFVKNIQGYCREKKVLLNKHRRWCLFYLHVLDICSCLL